METTEQIAYVIVLGLAFLMIAWGLWKLRGTGLLKRGRYPGPDYKTYKDDKGDHWIVPPELKDRNIISREHQTLDIDFMDRGPCGFQKKEDDLE